MDFLSRAIVLATSVLVACASGAPPRPPARTVASSRRPSGTHHGRVQRADPPAVDSAAQCPASARTSLTRITRVPGRTLHFGPLCTELTNGRFSAVFATGTPTEATDLWVMSHGERGDQIHRVRHFPVGARVEFGRIAQGWVYLLGRSRGLDDMPQGTQLLAIFALPRAGSAAPELPPLSPLEVVLLRATDAADLDRRLTFTVPERDPSAAEAQRAIDAIATEGPNALLDRLSPEGAPTLRVWQTGMYQEVDYVSPQGDPTSTHIARATALIREIAVHMDCSAGDRCVARSEESLVEGASRAQILLRVEGSRVVIAGILEASPAPSSGSAAGGAWGGESMASEEDLALAQALSVDGAVTGTVVSITRGEQRALAFDVNAPAGAGRTRVYVLSPNHSPRAYSDESIGEAVTGERELHFRDYERDGGFELITIARNSEANPIGSVASASPVPFVGQHDLTPRLDMLRVAFGDGALRDFDVHLRSFRPAPASPSQVCGLLDRMARADPRAVLAATGGSLTVIPYHEPGQPLRGSPARLGRREIQGGESSAALGAMSGLHCADLACDWNQSLCQARTAGRELGVLWFADGGRRLAAVSRLDPH